jgi:ABC-type spermidine/putrescine transport system permease subunit I
MRSYLRHSLALPPLVLLVTFFVVPLVYLFYVSFHAPSDSALYGDGPTLENYARVASDSIYGTIILRTLRTAMVVLVVTLVIGYSAAYTIVRIKSRWRVLLFAMLLFPLMVTNVVRAYGWVTLLGRKGILNSTFTDLGLISSPLAMLYTFEAVVVGLMTVLLPFMIITIANSLASIDPSYEEAAQSLGAGPFRTFVNVTLPLSSPGVTAGISLVFLLSLSAYVTVALMGGPRQKMLVSLVYDAVVNFQWPRAAAIAFVLLAIAFIGAAIVQAVLRPQRVSGRSS